MVGSGNSSNSVRLVEVALEAGAGSAYRVDDASEIDSAWLDGVGTVSVTSKVGQGTTRHFPATEWTINNAMGTEPKLPAWVDISTNIIPDELGKLLAGQYSPSQCMAVIKEQVDKAAAPFRKG